MTSAGTTTTAAATTAAAQMRRTRTRRRIAMALARLVFIGALVAFWEIGARTGVLDPFFFGRPFAAIGRLWTWVETGSLWGHLFSTVGTALLGYLLGVALGITIGAAFAFSPERISRIGNGFLVIGNGLPRLVLAPLFLLWFGVGTQAKLAFVVVVIVFIVAMNVFSGLRDVDRKMIDHVLLLGGNRWDLARVVYAPAIMGWLLASLRVCLGLSFAGAIVAEYVGSGHGLGYLMVYGFGIFDMNQAIAAMIAVFVVIGVLDRLLARLEFRVTAWKL